MPYTEFCCRSGGSNLNAGTRLGDGTEPGASPALTYASGSWVSSTGVFTVASGNPVSDGVAVGDFASVYADGASVTTLIGRVTARTSTTITVSTTAKAGTTTDGTSNRTLRIGGAWQGPNGSSGFPFNAITGACTNAAGDAPRVNFKNDQTYSITAAISHTLIGPVCFQGYSTSYGDLGKATIDGGTSGASYTLLTLSGSGVAYTLLADLIFKDNGATGSASLVSTGFDDRNMLLRCVFRGSRGAGASGQVFIECEAYGNNLSNTANTPGMFAAFAGAYFMRCISHDNTGSNTDGFYTQAAGVRWVNCIADTNGRDGFRINNVSGCNLTRCISYGNAGNGITQLTLPGTMVIENTILANNSGFGIVLSGQSMMAVINNCAFRSNTSGQTSSVGGALITGSVTLTADPFVDAPNGDFDLNATAGGGAACRNAGRGVFQQTAASYTGTLSFPDIGASQGQGASGGGLILLRPMNGGYSA